MQSPLTKEAGDFARDRHAGQRRDADGEPAVLHPLEVGDLLDDAGYEDELVAAGILHEVIEDTDADRRELERRFGEQVAALVEALSDDPSIDDPRERRAALRAQVAAAGPAAAAVFAADKVSKARELRIKAARAPLSGEDRIKLEHYEQSLAMLERAIPGAELLELLRRELAALHALPAGAGA